MILKNRFRFDSRHQVIRHVQAFPRKKLWVHAGPFHTFKEDLKTFWFIEGQKGKSTFGQMRTSISASPKALNAIMARNWACIRK